MTELLFIGLYLLGSIISAGVYTRVLWKRALRRGERQITWIRQEDESGPEPFWPMLGIVFCWPAVLAFYVVGGPIVLICVGVNRLTRPRGAYKLLDRDARDLRERDRDG